MDYIHKNIYYLNLKELALIANKFDIPYHIYLEKDSKLHKSSMCDPKVVIIKRILKFLEKKSISKSTIYPKHVIKFKTINKVNKNDHVYFGSYKNGNPYILRLMEQLTDNKFKFGALSCLILRNYWSKGIAPTYKRFAKKWLVLNNKKLEHPEWQYINDIPHFPNHAEWREHRTAIANKILHLLFVDLKSK